MFWFRDKSKAVETALEVKASSVSQLIAPSDDFLSLFGITPSASGAVVSPLTAMRVPSVRGAVLAISEAIGQAEAHIYSTGTNIKATDHPAYALLNSAVTPWQSASGFREQLTRDALIFGNGFASITRDGDGHAVELHHMPAAQVSVYVDLATLEPSYHYVPLEGTLLVYPFADVLHLRASSYNGTLGISPIMEGREAIGMAITLEAHANRLFGSGARPSGILTAPGKLDPGAVARIKASLQAMIGGSNSGQTAVFEQGMVFNQTALTSVDAQFEAMRKFQVEEIARVFRVNPILLQDMGRSTFSNAAETGRQFIQYTLAPWVVRWQNEVALKLLTLEERALYRVEIDTDSFDRADIGTRMTAYSTAIASRVMNPNECRALESQPPYPEGAAFFNPNTTANSTTTETIRVG